MATWPTILPAPIKEGISIALGDNALSRTSQSGRVCRVRYGSGAPDKVTGTLRLLRKHPSGQDLVEVFNQFYRVALNMGVNYFDAWWLEEKLGYTAHKAKFSAYPQFQVNAAGIYEDVGVTLLIRKASSCPDVLTEYVWPSW